MKRLNMTRKSMLILLLVGACSVGVQARVRLPHIIGDNMVLQQQADVRLWGWAQPGRNVKVTTSWSSQTVTARADRSGRWLVQVHTPQASYEPLSITFDDGEPLTIRNVLSGEVWVCAGRRLQPGGYRCTEPSWHPKRKDSQHDVCEAAGGCSV